jgi:general secretion pathway protein D
MKRSSTPKRRLPHGPLVAGLLAVGSAVAQQPPPQAVQPAASARPAPLTPPPPPAVRPLPAAPAASAPGLPAGALRSNTPVTLNFVNADIEAVTRAMAAMIDRQMLVDPRVRGQVTVYSERPQSVRDAYLNYLAALRGLGFTVVDTGGLLKVVPEADAKLQAGTVSVGPEIDRRGDQVITQIFRLTHETANSLVPVLRPLISPNNTINANPSSNTLVITDYASNLQRIAKIIAAMDTPASSDLDVIPLKHAVASDIAPLVQRLADGGGPTVPGVPQQPQVAGAAGGGSVLADPRSNSLIVRAANPARAASIRSIVDRLDRPNPDGGPAGNIYVVYLKNADATRLATVLRAAYSAGTPAPGATGAGAFAAGGTSASPLQTNTGSALGGATGSGQSPQATAPVTPQAAVSTGGFIQADPATNSLIITAAEPVYRQLRAVIDQLDSRRAQIFIESMIVQIEAEKAADLGFQWQGITGNTSSRNRVVAGSNFGSTGNIINLAIAGATGAVDGNPLRAGLNVGLLRQFGGVTTIAALARFLETAGGSNILSTPNVITLDNEESKFVNGRNVPFVTGSFTNTGTGSGSINPFQTIERRDVGLTLRVRPQVGEGGKVRMTVFQENSSLVEGSQSNLAGPTTNKSSIETTVEIEDGQIMVLGGLLSDGYVNNDEKVPLLGDLPVVGGLFRSESRRRAKTNLMVFLRPIVLRDAPAAEALALDRYETIRAYQQEAQPRQSSILPINDGPVLPPLRAPGDVPPQPQPVPGRSPAVPGLPSPPAEPASGVPRQ